MRCILLSNQPWIKEAPNTQGFLRAGFQLVSFDFNETGKECCDNVISSVAIRAKGANCVRVNASTKSEVRPSWQEPRARRPQACGADALHAGGNQLEASVVVMPCACAAFEKT